MLSFYSSMQDVCMMPHLTLLLIQGRLKILIYRAAEIQGRLG
jgi:hypothetical protein